LYADLSLSTYDRDYSTLVALVAGKIEDFTMLGVDRSTAEIVVGEVAVLALLAFLESYAEIYAVARNSYAVVELDGKVETCAAVDRIAYSCGVELKGNTHTFGASAILIALCAAIRDAVSEILVGIDRTGHN
jgi:hypothetical protein